VTGPSEARLDASGAARPSLCRAVIYRARTRGYPLAATVTAVQATLDAEGVARGDVPALSSPMHVHLHVMTPGAQIAYQEFDVPYGDGPGEWSWPPRV
jgi:hypothetical protein